MALTIPAIKEQYFRIPAHRFEQGHRTVFTFALGLAQLDSMLPQRVDDDVVREANRRLTPSHAKQIEVYLREHDDWVLGAILLGIDPDAFQFSPFQDEEGNQSPMFGELRIPYNRMSSFGCSMDNTVVEPSKKCLRDCVIWKRSAAKHSTMGSGMEMIRVLSRC